MADLPTSTTLKIPSFDTMAGLVKMLGPWTILALGLVYLTVVRNDDRLKALETASLSLEATVRANTEILAQHDMTGQLTLWVLQMTCINEADTPEKREKCLSRPEHGR